MAPIEPDLSNSNLRPFLLLGAFASSVTALAGLVGFRVLYRSYRALPPSQAARAREATRRKYVQAYQGLLFLSFSVALYYGFHFLSVSYQVWATERGEPVPTGLWRTGGLLTKDQPVSLKLGRWLNDTDLLGELWIVAFNGTRRQWWTQQLLLGAATWSTFVAIEGRRRNIPHVWAFIVLSMAVSLSFAQNLFFLALLLTPTPISEHDKHDDLVYSSPNSKGKHGRKPSKAIQNMAATTESSTTWIPHRVQQAFDSYFPPKPRNLAPHPLLLAFPLFCSTAGTILSALASNTSMSHTFVPHLAVDLLMPHVLLRLAPTSFGSTNQDPTLAHQTAFKAIGLTSSVIYATSLLFAVLDNSPLAGNRYWILPQHKSRTERLKHPEHAIGRILATLYEEPAVARVAWDVLLSGLSLSVWAGIRGADIGKMLRATGWVTKAEIKVAQEATEWVKKEAEQLVSPNEETDEPASPGKGKAKSSKSKKNDDADEGVVVLSGQAEASKQSAVASWTGDEDKDEDWEAGALSWGLLIVGGLGVGSAAVLGSGLI